MRLAVCALSAALLSGCSWFGGGGNSSAYNQSQSVSAYNANSAVYSGGAYGGGAYGSGAYGAAQGVNCASGSTYSYEQAGCAPSAGYGAQAYGAGVAANTAGAYGGAAYGGSTVLAANAPYGSAVQGGQLYGDAQYAANAAQVVQGSPIYVPQPYAQPVASACCGPKLRGGAALPLGLEAGIGTEFDVSGNIFPGEVAKASAATLVVSELDPISYNDAFGTALTYDLGATYDVNPSTTVLARVGYTHADGKRVQVGTVNNGAALTEDLFAEFGDLEQIRVEGGLRKYVGSLKGATGLRPYLGATAGVTYTDDIDLVQSSETIVQPTTFTQEYVDNGWQATASGVVGAEWQVGSRTAIGIESGIRWSDDVNSNFTSGDRWSVPVQLRGRVSF